MKWRGATGWRLGFGWACWLALGAGCGTSATTAPSGVAKPAPRVGATAPSASSARSAPLSAFPSLVGFEPRWDSDGKRAPALPVVADALVVEDGPALPPLAPLAAIAGADARRLWLATTDGTVAELVNGSVRVRGEAKKCLPAQTTSIELLSLAVSASGRVLATVRGLNDGNEQGDGTVELAGNSGPLRCTVARFTRNLALGDEFIRFGERELQTAGLAAPPLPGPWGYDAPSAATVDVRAAAVDELWALDGDGYVYRFDGVAWAARGNVTGGTRLWLDERRRPWVGGQVGLSRLVDEHWESVWERLVLALEGRSSRELWLVGEREVALFDGERFRTVAVAGLGGALWVAPDGTAWVGAQVAVPPPGGTTPGKVTQRTVLRHVKPKEIR